MSSHATPTPDPAKGSPPPGAQPLIPIRPVNPSPGLPTPELTHLVHEAAAPMHRDQVVVVRFHADHLDLALWPIPPSGRSNTEVLVGWRPDPGVRAVGLVSAGTARAIDPGTDQTRLDGPVTVTVITDVEGHTATVLEHQGGEVVTVPEPPTGWGADCLRRTLGLPTPRPEVPVSACVEGTWLAHLSAAAWDPSTGRSRALSWAEMAQMHPLGQAGQGLATPAPRSLARLTQLLDQESSWSALLEAVGSEIPGSTLNPPGGRQVPLAAWFDQGSFSRWMLRRVPDPDQVLFDLLDHLSEEGADRLLSALVSL